MSYWLSIMLIENNVVEFNIKDVYVQIDFWMIFIQEVESEWRQPFA